MNPSDPKSSNPGVWKGNLAPTHCWTVQSLPDFFFCSGECRRPSGPKTATARKTVVLPCKSRTATGRKHFLWACWADLQRWSGTKNHLVATVAVSFTIGRPWYTKQRFTSKCKLSVVQIQTYSISEPGLVSFFRNTVWCLYSRVQQSCWGWDGRNCCK